MLLLITHLGRLILQEQASVSVRSGVGAGGGRGVASACRPRAAQIDPQSEVQDCILCCCCELLNLNNSFKKLDHKIF